MSEETKEKPSKSGSNLDCIRAEGERWKNFPPCYIPKEYSENIKDQVLNMKVYDNDLLIAGYLRSGTTLMQEMTWLIVNNFDFEKAKKEFLDERCPFIDCFEFDQMIRYGKVKKTLDIVPRPRILRTHLPVQLLPNEIWQKKPTIIYMSRESKDVAISMYHFCNDFVHYHLTLENFLEKFLADGIMYTPYREHRVNFWNIPDYPNILYLTYEEVTNDIGEAIRKVAAFLGKQISEENFEKLKEHLKFDSMKENEALNNKEMLEKINEIKKENTRTDNFIRKGKIGGYKEEMPQEFIERFDRWIAEEKNMKSAFN